MHFPKAIAILAIFAFFSLPVFALSINGVHGTGSRIFSFDEQMAISSWPEDYRQLCIAHMNAVIKRCSEAGYENWVVDRMVSGTKFSPEYRQYSVQDFVVGNYSCTAKEHGIDETLITSAVLSMSFSQGNLCEAQKSDQYACSFTCEAWDCDSDIKKTEIHVCQGIDVNSIDKARDPLPQVGANCRKDAIETCESRGPGCSLKRPCEVRNKAGSELVFCDCSCEPQLPERTISDEALAKAQAETLSLSAFSLEEWQGQRVGAGSAVLKRADIVKTAAKDRGIDAGHVAAPSRRIMAKSRLGFSDSAGRLAGATGEEIVRTSGTNTAAVNFLNKELCDPTVGKPTDAVLINNGIPDPITIVTGDPVSTIPVDPVLDSREISTTINGWKACAEDWSCASYPNQWGDWSSCSAEKTQFKSRTRKCSDRNSCGTILNKPETTEMQSRACGDAARDANVNDANTNCTESWGCGTYGGWGSCLGGVQSHSRTCTDANHCGTTASRPALTESRSCTDTVPACTESWFCGEWAAGSWGACQENGTQSRTSTRTCTDGNNCGTTTSRPATSQSESQGCAYVPPKEYHEKESYLSMVSGATTGIATGQTLSYNLSPEQSIVYVLNMQYGKTYRFNIAATSPVSITYQQRYGPPQVTYTDTNPGETTISGGPNTDLFGDQQRIAIKIGPATSSLNGNIALVEI